MTLEEAFQTAGYPIPEGGTLCQIFGDLGCLYGDVFAFKDQECRAWARFTERQTTLGKAYEWTPSGSRDHSRCMRVNELPAINALKFLPDCISVHIPVGYS